MLFDLGVSSPQLDTPARGFSFAHDGPLDMRMNTTVGPTAAEWLATVSQPELAGVLARYGEEPRARQIAAATAAAERDASGHRRLGAQERPDRPPISD